MYLIRLDGERDLPDDLRAEFQRTVDAPTRVKPDQGSNEGSLADSTKALNVLAARELAHSIVALYVELAKRDPLDRIERR